MAGETCPWEEILRRAHCVRLLRMTMYGLREIYTALFVAIKILLRQLAANCGKQRPEFEFEYEQESEFEYESEYESKETKKQKELPPV